MSEDRPPSRNQSFEIGDLVRLNEELKQIREVLKRKRAEREQAKREGKKLQVDLTPEIERLGRFLVELERASSKFKATPLPLPGSKLVETNALGDVLGKVKAEIEKEKQKLEAERAAREQERLKHEQELQRLRDEVQRNRELLNSGQESLATVVTKTIEQPENLQPEPKEASETTKTPTGLEEERRQDDEDKINLKTKVTDEFAAIRSELQRLREQISREQDSLEVKRQDLDHEKRRIEEDRRILEAKIADTYSATKSELDRLREQISRKQEELEVKQKDLYDEKIKVDEEKRLLRERVADAENDRLRFMARKTMEELQNERSELSSLKRSLQQLRAESAKDRKRLERDREAILRARVTLESEKRKMAWKNTLLEIKARSALASQKTLKKEDKAEKKQTTRPGGHENNQEKVAATTPSGSSTEEGAVVLGVRLGDEDYGIDISRVREIMKRHAITPVPRQPVYVEGVMNVRGAIIPVINLRKRFDLKGEPPENPHTVIVDSAEGMVGILVDSVSEVIRLPQDRIHPAPPIASGMDGEYLRGICRVGDQLLLYLDVEKILRKATPVTMLQHGAQLGISSRTGRSSLSYDEQRVLKAIPPNGIGKTRLKKRTGFGDIKLQRTIALLSRKGLVKVSKEGSTKIIRRIIRATH